MVETTVEHTVSHDATRALEVSVRGLYDAWRDRDEGRMRTFFSDRDDLKLWGTDQFERIIGRAEADDTFAGWIATCPLWTSIEPTHRAIGVGDDLAWVADDVEGRWTQGSASGVVAYRMTTVWEAAGETWRLVHANVAIPH
jgi:SnoaL-like protein